MTGCDKCFVLETSWCESCMYSKFNQTELSILEDLFYANSQMPKAATNM